MQTEERTQPTNLRLDRPISVIAPRSLREQDAASYIGFSASYLRNQRVADVRAMRRGDAMKGPRWVTIKTAIRYLREDLDDWLNAGRTDPGQGDPEMVDPAT